MNELNITSFAAQKLISNLKAMFEDEDQREPLVLLHLIEIQKREIYAKMGFDNLFRMLIVLRVHRSANKESLPFEILTSDRSHYSGAGWWW